MTEAKKQPPINQNMERQDATKAGADAATATTAQASSTNENSIKKKKPNQREDDNSCLANTFKMIAAVVCCGCLFGTGAACGDCCDGCGCCDD